MAEISAKTGAKWHNLNLGFKLSINTGVGMLFWALGFFLLTHMAAHHPAIKDLYPVALTGWTAGIITFVLKRRDNNKLALDAQKAGLAADPGAGAASG